MPNSNHSSDASTPSPSVTSSVDSVISTPLPLSPKEGFLVVAPQPLQLKFPPDDGIPQPIIRSMATLAQPRHISLSPPPSSPYQRSIDEDTHILPHSSRPRRRYRPYIPRVGPVPPGLHYAARSLGITSPADITLDQVKEQREAFLDALSAMPDRILSRAFDAKQADHDCIALRLALTMAEIKSSEARISLLSAMREQHDGDAITSRAYLNFLSQALGDRDLREVKTSHQYYEKERATQLTALAIAQTHMSHMFEVIGPGCSRWLGEDNGGSMFASDDDSDNEDSASE